MSQRNGLFRAISPAEFRLEERIGGYEIGEFSEGHHGRASRRSDRQLLLEADEFVTKYDLDDIRDQIRKAALIVDDFENLERIVGLTEDEIGALRGESERRPILSKLVFQTWRLPTYMCHIGGILFSLAETWGAGTFFIYPEGKSLTRELAWFACKLIGCWLAVFFNKRFGRRGTANLAASLMIPASFGVQAEPKPSIQIVSAAMFAIAAGIFECTIPFYLAELSPAHNRGTIVSSWVINKWFSILFLVQFFVFESVLGTKTASLLTSILLLLCCWAAPESPYICALKGRVREAYGTLCQCRQNNIQAVCDLYRMHSSITQGKATAGQRNYKAGSDYNILSPNDRRAIVALTMVIVARIVSRVYAGFVKLESPPSLPVALIILCVFLLVGARPISLPFLDLIGRRPMILFSMLLTLLVVILECVGTFLTKSVIVGFAHLIMLLPIAVEYLLPVIYATEIFPFEFKETGMAISTSMLLVSDKAVDWLVSNIEQPEAKAFSDAHYAFGALASLGLLQVVATIFVYLLTRETAGRSLEDIGAVFEATTKDLVLYRLRIHLPYIFERYFLWKDVQLCPFEQSKHNPRYGVDPAPGEEDVRALLPLADEA